MTVIETIEALRHDTLAAERKISDLQSACSHTWTYEEPTYREINGSRYTDQLAYTRTCTTCALQESRSYRDACVSCLFEPNPAPSYGRNRVADQLNAAMLADGYTGLHAFFGIECPDCNLNVVWMEWDR